MNDESPCARCGQLVIPNAQGDCPACRVPFIVHATPVPAVEVVERGLIERLIIWSVLRAMLGLLAMIGWGLVVVFIIFVLGIHLPDVMQVLFLVLFLASMYYVQQVASRCATSSTNLGRSAIDIIRFDLLKLRYCLWSDGDADEHGRKRPPDE